ncbi:palmitoyltransferase ZDHHC11-like isoform X2 [Sceloporus undulatus]|uniref:palmitoyltransferase ZDHHC11-like isoform X2 n=1 Tax=Sceloporus undulatus TaxID=8520 RepID=UPI001C4D6D88|nr:palmitoyltransferase ZDHHC11-like isoform X2 [Sceloporus undulatus]
MVQKWVPGSGFKMIRCYKRLRQTGPERLIDHKVVPLYSRVNGWSLPLHSFQLITFLLYSYLAIVGFSIYIPLLPNEWKYVAYIVIGIIFVHHLITHLVAVTIDPADENILAKKNYNKPMPSFDRSKCKHVIQNHHCSLCETDVGPKTKHCSTCNKCIADFDHHCNWLNNCIGSRNYWFFFNAVASALVGILLMILVILYIFIQYFVNPAQLRTSPQFESVSGNGTWLAFLPVAPVETTAVGILTLAALTMALGTASLFLLGHLLLFHLYLLSKKMNTYEYMIQHHPKQCTISQDMSAGATSDTTCKMEPLQELFQGRKTDNIKLPTIAGTLPA